MNVSWLRPGAALAVERGQSVICIPVYGGHEYFVSCLDSVLSHTPPDAQILICDDASPDPRTAEFVSQLEAGSEFPHAISYLRQERNLGFPGNMNSAFAATAPADVVVLNSDCEVAEGWLDGLTEAAHVDSRVATATTLTNHGTIVSVPHRNQPSPALPPSWTLEEAASAIRGASLRIRPRLPTAVGHCMYVRRMALELVGDFDLAFTPGYGEEVDFSQRCVQAGLRHVLADDVLVFHHGGASLSVNGGTNPAQERNERLLKQRYPYYHRVVADAARDLTSPLARALGVARRALCGTSVVMDARVLNGPMTGTQLQVLEVITALARTGQLQMTVITPERLEASVSEILARLPGVGLVSDEAVAEEGIERADLVHRPYQVGTHEDIAFLAPLGERLVVTNQDLISFQNPSYFRSVKAWEGYQAITRSALAVADHVVFIADHGRDEAVAEGLLDVHRTSVVHNGVDHTVLGAGSAAPEPPAGCEDLPAGAQVLLCLGTDFRHKNRLFLLQLLAELRLRYDWPGYLVLAGPHVDQGSTAAEERAWLEEHQGPAGAVLDLGVVTETGKEWLYERCSLVLYPTVYEGFGLVPFEAADRDRACMWAAVTSLAEVLPGEAASVVPWSIELTAERAIELLRDEACRRRNIETVREAARMLTWDRAATELVRVYQQACDRPATPASSIERRTGIMQGVLTRDAMRLMGPHGVLPRELQRPLLALAMHPQLARPLFRAMRFGYAAGYTWRRWRRRAGDAGPGDAN